MNAMFFIILGLTAFIRITCNQVVKMAPLTRMQLCSGGPCEPSDPQTGLLMAACSSPGLVGTESCTHMQLARTPTHMQLARTPTHMRLARTPPHSCDWHTHATGAHTHDWHTPTHTCDWHTHTHIELFLLKEENCLRYHCRSS